jgi:hypothetical protein
MEQGLRQNDTLGQPCFRWTLEVPVRFAIAVVAELC